VPTVPLPTTTWIPDIFENSLISMPGECS